MFYRESMPFASRLREIMKAREVEQTTLGRGLGVTSQAVTQWVNGGTQPRGARLAKIAEFLDVAPADLLAPVGTPFGGSVTTTKKPGVNPHDSSDLQETPSEVLLMRLWGHMSPDMQNAILDLALAYARAAAKVSDGKKVSGGH